MDRVRGVDCGKVQDPQDLGYIPRFRLFGREVFWLYGGLGVGKSAYWGVARGSVERSSSVAVYLGSPLVRPGSLPLQS